MNYSGILTLFIRAIIVNLGINDLKKDFVEGFMKISPDLL